jgi:hypothetical protein
MAVQRCKGFTIWLGATEVLCNSVEAMQTLPRRRYTCIPSFSKLSFDSLPVSPAPPPHEMEFLEGEA